MPLRNIILLRRLAQSRRVTLPNGRLFLARYERVNRVSLYPTNKKNLYAKNRFKKTKKTEKKTARGKWVRNIIRRIDLGKRAANTGIDHGKRAANTEVGRMIVDDVVSLIPKGYKPLKNKLFRRKKKQHLLNLTNQLK